MKSTDTALVGQLQRCAQCVLASCLHKFSLLKGWFVVLETLFMWIFCGEGMGEKGMSSFFFYSVCC